MPRVASPPGAAALNGGAPVKLTNFTGLELFTYEWSPNGKQLYLSRGQTSNDVVLISDFH